MAKSRAKHAARQLDIPYELVGGTPRITAWGNERLWVENHQGILEYSTKRARFKTMTGEIAILGEGFIFEYSGAGSACITGRIDSISISEAVADAF